MKKIKNIFVGSISGFLTGFIYVSVLNTIRPTLDVIDEVYGFGVMLIVSILIMVVIVLTHNLIIKFLKK